MEIAQGPDTACQVALVDPVGAGCGRVRVLHLRGEMADEQHITLAELPQADKMEIFNWANREAASARPFREEQAQPVGAA